MRQDKDLSLSGSAERISDLEQVALELRVLAFLERLAEIKGGIWRRRADNFCKYLQLQNGSCTELLCRAGP